MTDFKECEFLATCPIFSLSCSEGVESFWLACYCKIACERCERRKLQLEGQEVPVTLLPDGTHLESLAQPA
jgi:hypothetical protein